MEYTQQSKERFFVYTDTLEEQEIIKHSFRQMMDIHFMDGTYRHRGLCGNATFVLREVLSAFVLETEAEQVARFFCDYVMSQTPNATALTEISANAHAFK